MDIIEGTTMGLGSFLSSIGVDVENVKKQLANSVIGKQVTAAKEYAEDVVDDIGDAYADTIAAVKEQKRLNKKARDNGATGLVISGKEITKDDVVDAIKDRYVQANTAKPVVEANAWEVEPGLEDQSLGMLMASKIRPTVRSKGVGALDELHDEVAVTKKMLAARAARQAEVDKANTIAQQRGIRFWDKQKPSLAMELNDLYRRQAGRGWEAMNNVNPSVAEGVVKKFYQDKVVNR